MQTMAPISRMTVARHRRRSRARGGILLEVSISMGFAAIVALLLMRASLLALSNNQWTIMQTLTDAFLTRETALSHRFPLADITAADSPWPDAASGSPPSLPITLGKVAGGKVVNATLTRFRVNETPVDDTDTNISVWRLHSVLTYKVGDEEYVKSRATLRMQ